MILSLCFFAIAVMAYAIKELQSHGNLKWMDYDSNFWGENSYYRKYTSMMQPPLENWYYKLFKIGYKERFPLSATALVWLTDGYHLMQFFFIKLFVASIILYSPMFSWWVDGLVYLGVWYLTFWAVYNSLQKKSK